MTASGSTSGGALGRSYEGGLGGRGLKLGIVVSRFNEIITTRLLKGAKEALQRLEINEEDMDVAWVPGSLEIPLTAKTMAKSGRYHAIVCLGAVIRGETAHFDYVSSGATQGIVNANLETEVPIIFGVLTTYTVEQAMVRSGGQMGNKGSDAVVTAVQMANLLKELRSP